MKFTIHTRSEQYHVVSPTDAGIGLEWLDKARTKLGPHITDVKAQPCRNHSPSFSMDEAEARRFGDLFAKRVCVTLAMPEGMLDDLYDWRVNDDDPNSTTAVLRYTCEHQEVIDALVAYYHSADRQEYLASLSG